LEAFSIKEDSVIADLEGILALNEIDQQIFQLKRKQNELPLEIEKIKEGIKSERQELSGLEDKQAELEKETRRLEDEVKEHKEGLAKSEEKLMHIKTNEEYDAVHNEISTRKTRISEGEDRILQLMGEKEALEAKRKETADKQDQSASKQKEDQLLALKKDFDSLEADITAAEAMRSEAAKKIGNRFLQVYERIHRIKKNGSHVSIVTDKKRFCSICGCSLTSQRFIEVKRNNAINTCESCGSVLIWKIEEEVKS
jgi:uncharacterized protein